MLKKIMNLFKTKKEINNQLVKSKTPHKQNKKIESTRIGELGEYKINIQLDQLPKECKYISDIMITNKKSRSGYSKEDRNWSVSNRFKMYNPLKQNYGHIKALEALLSSYPSLLFISIVSFTMRARFSIDPSLRKIDSNELIIYDVELSEFISRKINRINATSNLTVYSTLDIDTILKIIQSSNITDPVLRAEHVKGAK